MWEHNVPPKAPGPPAPYEDMPGYCRWCGRAQKNRLKHEATCATAERIRGRTDAPEHPPDSKQP